MLLVPSSHFVKEKGFAPVFLAYLAALNLCQAPCKDAKYMGLIINITNVLRCPARPGISSLRGQSHFHFAKGISIGKCLSQEFF